jgi:pilus assembly protein CpaC
VTVSGQDASFLAGGKFPVPVPQVNGGANTTITVDYQEFGVRLNFTPVVLGNGRIRLKVTPEVSDLDFSNGLTNAGFKIPLINTRRVNTTIEMAEGQTFAIAGLLSNNIAASNDATPLLGDLPVLGALFRSVRYQRRETELLVLVTPQLVEPMNPAQVPAAPGEQWREPNESDLFLKGDIGGPKAAAPAPAEPTEPAVARQPKTFQGTYGFQPVATTNE